MGGSLWWEAMRMRPGLRRSIAAAALAATVLLMNGCGGCTGQNWRQGAMDSPPTSYLLDVSPA